MPTYTYHCADCGAQFDKQRSIDRRTEPAPCDCGAEATLRITAPAIPPEGALSHRPHRRRL